MNINPLGPVVEALQPGDLGFATFDQVAFLTPPIDNALATTSHPRPDIVSAVTAGAMALKVAATAERLTRITDTARRLTADAPPTSPALDASDDL